MAGMSWFRSRHFWAFGAHIAQILTLLVAVIALYCQIRDVGKHVERVEQQTLRNFLRITYPYNGDTVELTGLVRGSTPYSDRNNYIVVTPLQTGGNWVQDGPLTIDSGGQWTVQAKFGDAGAGEGQRFIIRALASKYSLKPGPLIEVPQDAVFSDAVTVTREK
jgi:hypothetical protein